MPIRIIGPYKHGRGLRFRIQTGPRAFVWAGTDESEARARRLAEARAEGLQERIDLTVGGLCVRYLERLDARGCKPQTITATRNKLASLVGEHEELEAVAVTPRKARALYQDLVDSGVAAATHQQALRQARSAWRWGLRQGLVRSNPWTEVDMLGKARLGKMQLRNDESRKLADVCMAHVLSDDGALAVLMALFMGLRVSEITKRVVRDVDEDCTVLVVEDAKTKHGYRRPEIPDCLQAALRLRCQNRAATAPLLRQPDGRPMYEKLINISLDRYCKAAGVPRVVPHALRGGFASALVEAGAQTHLVAAVMGHGSFEGTTRRHYVNEDVASKAQDRARLRHLKVVV